MYNNRMSIESKFFSKRLCGVVVFSALLSFFVPIVKALDDQTRVAVDTLATQPPPGGQQDLMDNQLSVTNAGAVGDGKTLNTVAFQKAIDALATNGGGTLVIPEGKFLSGAIFLKAGVNLHLDKGAVLQGSTNIADYPERMTRIEGHFQVWIPALVNAANADHLRISGEGTIQGGGQPYWTAFWKSIAADKVPKNLGKRGVVVSPTKNLDVPRPRNMFISDSKDVKISGISLRQSGFWNMHLFRCSDVTVENVDIRTPYHSPSTDGIDVDSCQDVTIRGCYISVDDDNIALKGNKGTSAWDDKTIPPDEHIRISGCTFGMGNSALTLGSEATLVRDVVIEDCKLAPAGTNVNCVLKLKLRTDTEQHYEDITARNITVDNTHAQMVSIEGWSQYFDLKGKPAPSQLATNITLENISGNLQKFGVVNGPKKSTVTGLTFRNINLTLKVPDVSVQGVNNLVMDNVNIKMAPPSEKRSKTRKETPASADQDGQSSK
jgi:alpha-L-rhamnosidase